MKTHQSLDVALGALSAAHGAKALAGAFAALQGAIRRQRLAADAKQGSLAQTYAAAMAQWDREKAEGVSVEDRRAHLELQLRAAWPQGREWKYLCSRCQDYGLQMAPCLGDATCGRTSEHPPHDFGTPCWCARGARYKPKEPPAEGDHTAAGRSKPTRLGRR